MGESCKVPFAKRVSHWVSSVHWVAALTNAVNYCVCRRGVIAYIVFDLIISILVIWFFAVFKSTSKTGWIIRGWKGQLSVWIFRILCGIFGIVVVFQRRLARTRFYYGLFFLNFILGFMTLTDILQLSCKCDHYRGCKVLRDFVPEGSKLMNPFPPPADEKLDGKRTIPYEEMPERVSDEDVVSSMTLKKKTAVDEDEATEALLELESKARGLDKEAEALVELESKAINHAHRGAENVRVAVTARATGKREMVSGDPDGSALAVQLGAGTLEREHQQASEPIVRKRGRHRALPALLEVQAEGSEPEPQEDQTTTPEPDSHDRPPSPLHINQEAAKALQKHWHMRERRLDGKKGEPDTPEKGGSYIMRSFKRWKTWDHEKMGYSPVHFFNITSKGIFWNGSSQVKNCKKEKLNKKDARILGEKLRLIRKDPENAELGVGIISLLWLCIRDPLCGTVGSRVVHRDGVWHFETCTMNLQQVPQILEHEGHDEETWLYFQRNAVVIRSDLHSGAATSKKKLHGEILKQTTVTEGMKLIKEISEEGCFCKESTDSCRFSTDVHGKDHYWCWVDEKALHTCESKGVRLFKDEKTGQPWSEELCHTNRCRCSGLGMFPVMGTTSKQINTDLMWPNFLNYGRTCEKWNTADEQPWCWVGWDSTCADRAKPEEEYQQTSSFANMNMQYWSRLPCDRADQATISFKASEKCVDLTRMLQGLLIVLYILSLPMFAVLFKFIQNRCGDEFSEEDQFVVVYSDDEDGDKEEEEKEEEEQQQSSDREAEPSGGAGAGRAAGSGA